jgi:predicted alpha/beta-hydrolase family hydrolase
MSTVPVEGGAVSTRHYPARPPALPAALALAHGAGGDQHSPFIVAYATALAERGIEVTTFNFLYSEARRRLPDARPKLEACFRGVIEAISARLPGKTALFAGGKSMGGRIATHLAAAEPSLPLAGIVLLGYPLHPPGRPEQRRDAHLAAVGRPMLFVQGSRDAFGTPAELSPLLERISPRPGLYIVEGGDHSFRVRRLPAAAQEALHRAAQDAVAGWIREIATSALR